MTSLPARERSVSPANFLALGSGCGAIFTASDSGVGNFELWGTDGTPGGTALVQEIRPGAQGAFDSIAPGFALIGGSVYFAADNGSDGPEPFSGTTGDLSTAAPQITLQPVSQSNCPGQSVTFTIAATNSPMFQWRENGIILPGETATSLTINPVTLGHDGNVYDCVVSNACGTKISDPATLTSPTQDPPVITVPPAVTIECDESTDPNVNLTLGVATATDVCDPNPTISFSDASAGTCPTIITRTWTATDATGNSASGTQMITVQDTNGPMVTAPANVTIECTDSTDPSNTGTPTVVDNCDPAPTVSFSDVVSAGSCPQGSVITRTWNAVDSCGNPGSAIQTITVVDSTGPVVTVPPTATVECDALECTGRDRDGDGDGQL